MKTRLQKVIGSPQQAQWYSLLILILPLGHRNAYNIWHWAAGTLLGPLQLNKKGFELRRAICLMLSRSRKEVEPFIDGNFDAYLHYMATEGVWGGNLSVLVIGNESKAFISCTSFKFANTVPRVFTVSNRTVLRSCRTSQVGQMCHIV